MGDVHGTGPDQHDARELAIAMTRLFDATRRMVTSEGGQALADMVTGHLGVHLRHIPNVTTTYGGWDHVNVQRGVDAYLAEHSPDAEWFGIAGAGRGHQDLAEMLALAGTQHGYELGAVDYATVATGPGSVTEAVLLGLVCTRGPDGAPVVITMRGPNDFMGRSGPECRIQILAADRTAATLVRDEIDRLVRAHDCFRGAILQFDVNDRRGGFESITFLPRPVLAATDVVLPAGVLESLERHVVRGAAHNDRLVALGQHLKRGLLLYGPPGTGKTHTVRYLMSRLTGATVVVLSGRALGMLSAASALVRRLEPAVLVIEDVDLVAEDRAIGGTSRPLLFELLNRIDGIDADADVTFVLTTNRVEALEKALVDRPGRVDLAVEIPRPGPTERRRLLHLYARDVTLRLADEDKLIEALDGVTASFVRELVRRAVLTKLDETHVTLTDGDLLGVLAELTSERNAVTSRILGGA